MKRSSATLAVPIDQPILPRLSGAASLRTELEAVLRAAPPDASPGVFRELILQANVAGKGSASARIWLWNRIKLRYVLDPAVPEYRAFADAMRETASPDERGLLCMLMLGRTDRLFREVTLECVSPFLREEGVVVETAAIDGAVRRRAAASGAEWSPNTFDGTHRHLLSALKDFGVLRGARTRRTARPRPGAQVALFGAQLARLERLTDRQALSARWFRLLGLGPEQVVELLYVAHRAGALGFRMQADVVELRLPSLEAA